MFLRKMLRLPKRLAIRLTFWYAGIFSLSSLIAFLAFYFLIINFIQSRTDQELVNRVNDFSTLLDLRGIDAVKRVAVLEAQAAGEKKIFFRLLNPTGEVFSSSNMSYWRNIKIQKKAIRQLIKGQRHFIETIFIPGHKHKIRILYGIIGPGIILQLGQSMENYTGFIEAFQKIFIFSMAFLIFVAAGVGWFMARRALSGVEAVTQTARNISGKDLEKRVPVKPRGDEIDQLALTFNQMLDRIQNLVTGIQEMSDNIAHDLRSPITRIRGLAEVTLTTGRSITEYEEMTASTIEECDRLLDMINTMLVISETEAGAGNLNLMTMDIAQTIQNACDLFQPMADDKGLILKGRFPGRLTYRGDIKMIQRMISNLIDNSVKYTPAGGKIIVSAHADHGGQIIITVEDTGIGIADDEITQIFRRFYRCDQSRSKSGIGLGLSLARAIARAHQGDIHVKSEPGKGSRFRVNLPVNPKDMKTHDRNDHSGRYGLKIRSTRS